MRHRRGVIGIGSITSSVITRSAGTLYSQLTHFGMVDNYEYNDWRFKTSALALGAYAHIGQVLNNPHSAASGDDNQLWGLAFSSDGKRVYTQSYGFTKIHYMTTPGNIADSYTYANSGQYLDSTYNPDPYGLDISTGGECMFQGRWSNGGNNARIVKYNLNTPFEFNNSEGNTANNVETLAGHRRWDIETGHTSTNGLRSSPLGFTFKDDGTKMYLIGNGYDTVSEFTLSTAWNVGTKSLANIYDISSKCGNAVAVDIVDNGTKMYIIDSAIDKVFRCSLSTAWDTSTASFDTDQEWSIEYGHNPPRTIRWKSDGTRFWLLGNSSYIYEYTVSTAWDLTSTISAIETKQTSSNANGLDWTSDGRHLAVACGGGGNDTLRFYRSSIPWTITDNGTDTLTTLNSIDLDHFCIGQTDVWDVFFSNDDDNPYMFTLGGSAPNNITRHNMVNTTDPKSIDLGYWTSTTSSFNNSFTEVEWSPDGMSMFFSKETGELYQVNVSYPYHLNPYLDTNVDENGLSSAVKSLDLSGFITSLRSFTFRLDDSGKTLLTLDPGSDRVRVWRLRESWDISSGAYNFVEDNLSTEDIVGDEPRAIAISNDKTSIIMADRINDEVHQYRLIF